MHVSGRAHISYTSYISSWVHTQTCRYTNVQTHTHTHTNTHAHHVHISTVGVEEPLSRGFWYTFCAKVLIRLKIRTVESCAYTRRITLVTIKLHLRYVLMTCTHRYTYAHTNARMHTPIHVCTHPYTYACKCMLCVCAYVCKVRTIT
jgi:hypothetical protein